MGSLGAAAACVVVACSLALVVHAGAWIACGSMTATPESTAAPGSPPQRATPHCVPGLHYGVFLLVVPALAGILGVVVARPWLAWSGAGIQAATSLMYMPLEPWLGLAGAFIATLTIAGAQLAALVWWHRGHRKGVADEAARPTPVGVGKPVVQVAAALLATLALLGWLPQIPDYWDPCHEWGVSSGGSRTAEAGAACSSGSSTSLTRGEHAAMMLGIFGVPLALAIVAGFASQRRHGPSLVAAGILLVAHGFLVAFVTFPAFIVTWPVAAVWIGFGVEWWRKSRGRSRQAPLQTTL